MCDIIISSFLKGELLNQPSVKKSGNGGGGSGGSIRIEGGTISHLTTVDALGAPSYTPAGQGRITVYYQNSLSGLVSNPTAYTALIGVPPSPTASPTPINNVTYPYGTGIAGALLGNVAGAGAAMTTYMELTEWIPLAALVVGAVIVVHSNCIGDWKNKFGTNK